MLEARREVAERVGLRDEREARERQREEEREGQRLVADLLERMRQARREEEAETARHRALLLDFLKRPSLFLSVLEPPPSPRIAVSLPAAPRPRPMHARTPRESDPFAGREKIPMPEGWGVREADEEEDREALSRFHLGGLPQSERASCWCGWVGGDHDHEAAEGGGEEFEYESLCDSYSASESEEDEEEKRFGPTYFPEDFDEDF
uniref:Uncharacterized protein n=1 Tax=Chromera velia CCMP2878 TaxID=1169474 RepID=A0A0G4H9H3_9ALVE|eukprot:Cvel_5952.t1-p1 / transcript=Cvel_5952.t1 / gene=Cvel_5952 / organism=Chromera_velia_CCMP2878 / gene_product=hypothetical protein / transcript_product=hypothetical protein / location=Cvel_scaffold284:87854-88468(+) / protein_length=205 / sequence_SO=supercontig / SO=protein_coding / is_pseudo=false